MRNITDIVNISMQKIKKHKLHIFWKIIYCKIANCKVSQKERGPRRTPVLLTLSGNPGGRPYREFSQKLGCWKALLPTSRDGSSIGGVITAAIEYHVPWKTDRRLWKIAWSDFVFIILCVRASHGKVVDKARAGSTRGNRKRKEGKTNKHPIHKSRTVRISSAFVWLRFVYFLRLKDYHFSFCTHGTHYTNDFP